MSITKSFNFDFLKQNLRKSRGAIILCLVIVPLIMSIYLVVAGIVSSKPEVIYPESIIRTDLVFMYVIPYVLSSVLFGFVYKKKSTDFINSMPINRKTLFVTNTIGGIVLITIIQVVTGLLALLWGAIFSNIIVFPALILDMIIISWTSYVFVFIVSNLAMSVSGTAPTQFVIILLILFLIPFSTEMIELIKDQNNIKNVIVINNGELSRKFDIIEQTKNYTMPFYFFRYSVSFSWKLVIKMICLSIIFNYLGLKLYQKRKMEYNEESFSSVRFHILVKMLTLVPILLFVNMINSYEDSVIYMVVALIICGIYYILFDIIAKKKVPFAITIVSFAGTFLIIQMVTVFISNLDTNYKDIDLEDIKAVSLGNDNNSYHFYTNTDDGLFDENYYFKDLRIVELILKGNTTYSYNDSYDGKYIDFNIKLKSGKKYTMYTYINEKSYNEIINILLDDEKYMSYKEKEFFKTSGIMQLGKTILDRKTQKLAEKSIRENIMYSEDLQKLYNYVGNSNSLDHITKEVYEDHKEKSYYISFEDNNELEEIVANSLNKITSKSINKLDDITNFSVYDEDSRISTYDGNEEIIDFIEEHEDDEFDSSKDYYILRIINNDDEYIFFSNDVGGIDKLMDKSVEWSDGYYYYD